MAALLCLFLGASVVADGWVRPMPEVTGQRRAELPAADEVEAPAPSLVPLPPPELRRRDGVRPAAALPGAVEPAGWLGRRHLRLPD